MKDLVNISKKKNGSKGTQNKTHFAGYKQTIVLLMYNTKFTIVRTI